MLSLCNLFIKIYTEIFHVVYKGNVPSFQGKVSFDWPSSMGELDGLSLIFIDFYVPSLERSFQYLYALCVEQKQG
jgi:hypothetical protein